MHLCPTATTSDNVRFDVPITLMDKAELLNGVSGLGFGQFRQSEQLSFYILEATDAQEALDLWYPAK